MLRQIVPGIFAISGLKMGRAYLVEGEGGGLALIDTSTAGVDARISSAIGESGHRPGDLRAIIATHYHLDHTGNAQALRSATGAQLYVHEDDATFVDGTTPWMATRGAWSFLDRIRAAPVRAHSRPRRCATATCFRSPAGCGSCTLPGTRPGTWRCCAEERGVLFAGDALMNIVGLRLPMALSTHDMASARASVHKLARLEFDVALPGHGTPIIGRASEKLGAWARNWL